LYGSGDKFRSDQQRDTVYAIVNGVSPLVAVFPRDAGNTLFLWQPTFLLATGHAITSLVVCTDISHVAPLGSNFRSLDSASLRPFTTLFFWNITVQCIILDFNWRITG
jgi:hypothetical protein